MSTQYPLAKDLNKPSRLVKHLCDRLFAALALIVLTPLLLFVAIVVYFGLGQPILFTQNRAGKQARTFKVYKFRSMTDARDRNGDLLPDEQRLTRLGKFLRRVKLDELLQLWNIAKGDMSFVGPRPTIPSQVEEYDDFQKRRLVVNPGLTGWAQVNGNIELTWDERIRLDIWYLNHWSLWLDFTIVLKTVGVVLWGEKPNMKAVNDAEKYAIANELISETATIV